MDHLILHLHLQPLQSHGTKAQWLKYKINSRWWSQGTFTNQKLHILCQANPSEEIGTMNYATKGFLFRLKEAFYQLISRDYVVLEASSQETGALGHCHHNIRA